MDARRLQYCRQVITYMDDYAKLVYFKNKAGYGEVLTAEELSQLEALPQLLSREMQSINALQSQLGYDVGFPFLEDSNFQGFSIKAGELVGDLTYAYQIACPWYTDFIYEKSDNSFLFEIAVFLRALTDVSEYAVTPTQKVTCRSQLLKK